jgi:hypothetical protein
MSETSTKRAASCGHFHINQGVLSVKMHGVISKTMPDKGFFFLTGDNSIFYFMHISELEKAGMNQPASATDCRLTSRCDPKVRGL